MAGKKAFRKPFKRGRRRGPYDRAQQSPIKAAPAVVGALGLSVAFGLIAAAADGFAGTTSATTPSAGEFTCQVASITDGDTLRCSDGRRVRLSGVAARETDGSCSPGHPCPNATAAAATAELTRLASGQMLQCKAVGKTYNRTAAFCRNEDGVDLSCAMVKSGTALRWDRYWGWHSC